MTSQAATWNSPAMNFPGLDVSAADVSNLPFPDHRHLLVACNRSSRSQKGANAKAKAWADQSFHEPIVLLDDIIQVFCLSQP